MPSLPIPHSGQRLSHEFQDLGSGDISRGHGRNPGTGRLEGPYSTTALCHCPDTDGTTSGEDLEDANASQFDPEVTECLEASLSHFR